MGNDFSNYGNYPAAHADPAAAGAALAIFGGMMLFFLLFFFAYYLYFAICLMKIAKKTSTENAWFAWIPILNVILAIQIAQKPVWWIILFFIPLANIIVSILVWMGIAKNLGKPDWLGILIIVPIANIIIPGYLAFSSSESASNNNSALPQQPTAYLSAS